MSNLTPEQLAKSQGHLSDTMAMTSVLHALVSTGLQPENVLGHRHVIVPPGYRLQEITELVEKAQDEPSRKRGVFKMADVDSLVAYCKDQEATSTGYIYADADTQSITAVFNDHRHLDHAGWRDHRAVFKPEYTPEFQRWIGKAKNPMEQVAFAEFIEDNFADITDTRDASGAVLSSATLLLEMATTLQAKTAIEFKSARRLDNGQNQLLYNEVVSTTAGAAGNLTIPREFTLAIRIFRHINVAYIIRARLKYALRGAAVHFRYELDRPERSVEDAFAGFVQRVREESGYTVLAGVAGA